jgi:hypothetical protein
MSSYILYDSLWKRTDENTIVSRDEKLWLIDTINNKLDLQGKEKLYSLLLIFNKHHSIRESPDPYYDVQNVHPRLLTLWLKFTKFHLKTQPQKRFAKLDSRLW